MNKIETLIKELCPNGVEWNSINNCTRSITSPKKLQKNQYEMSGQIPIIDQGATFIAGFSNINEYLPHGEYVIFGDHSEHIKFVNFPFVQGADGLKILVTKKSIIPKYLYYCFSNFYKKEKNYKRHWSKAKETLIPIPPLEIQEEIVKILDKFTDYVTELTTELTLRQKQYNYYRDKLLSFENEVQIKKLSELATIKARIGWQGLTKKEYLKTGKYYLVTGTDFVKGTVNFSTCHFVEEERYLQDINIQLKNEDVLVTKDGTLGKVAYITNLPGPTTLNSGVFVVRKNSDEILSRYLYHYLNSPYLMKFAQSRLTGGTIKHLNQNVIVDFPIPIPDLEKQKEIIYILDSFNSIVNSLEKGLPKEIELRQKQYEYYRDKLLTFD